ncbi:hypothetical protein BKA66DRAFT_479245, partial [Pyrenochaeta sp. MPI-SDFR-AT-0127]
MTPLVMNLPMDILLVRLGATGALASLFVGLGTYQPNSLRSYQALHPSEQINQKEILSGLLYIHESLLCVSHL